ADIAFELALRDARYLPMVHRFGQDFVIVANVLQRAGACGAGLWNEAHRFYFDVIRHDQGRFPLEIYSMVGLVPLFAASVKAPEMLERLPILKAHVETVLN